MPADDPSELFDVCDADGRLLGITKPRGLVHRDGDWHRSVHIWVVLKEGPSVVLQRRALTKDTHPGKVDVSVAGHLRAGETVLDAVCEAEEEIGLKVEVHELTRLGLRRRADVGPQIVDREVQEIYCVTTARTLESLRPDPAEVSGILSVRLPDAIALVRGEVARVEARETRGGEAREVVLEKGDLLADPDGYFAKALGSIAKRAAGELEEAWVLDGAEDERVDLAEG
jgi:isopentenyldiphosphate isomerase